MEMLEIILEEILIRFSFYHDDLIHKKYLGHVLKFQEMDQGRFIGAEIDIWMLHFGIASDFGKSVDVAYIHIIYEERRVGRDEKLRSYIAADLFYHPDKTSLHLRMEINFRFIDDERSVFEIIAIDGEDDNQQRLFSITQIIESEPMSKTVYDPESELTIGVFYDQILIEIFIHSKSEALEKFRFLEFFFNRLRRKIRLGRSIRDIFLRAIVEDVPYLFCTKEVSHI